MGFDGQLVESGYKLEDKITSLESEEKNLLARTTGITDTDQLRGQIEIVEKEAKGIENDLNKFDFSPEDRRTTRELVSNLDTRIVRLNETRYSLLSDKERINSALGVHLSIDLKSLQKIFSDSKIYFGDQVAKDFAALEQFNKTLAEERDEYLRKDLEEIETKLHSTNEELEVLNVQRADAIASLTDSSSLSKYKRLSKQLVDRQATLENLHRLQDTLNELNKKRKQIKQEKKKLDEISTSLEKQVNNPPQRYQNIRKHFDEIVKKVIDKHANLFSRVNDYGHLEFDVNVLDDAAKPSSAGQGFSYGRLLCIAFDLAIMRAYATERFPHFVFHDGLLETLDDRKKLNLIDVVREYCNLGIQHIVTVIESELPRAANGRKVSFSENEVILTLTDEGERGRLFKMLPW